MFLQKRAVISSASEKTLINILNRLGFSPSVCLDASDPDSYPGTGVNINNVGTNSNVDYFVNDTQTFTVDDLKSHFSSVAGSLSRITENSDELRLVQDNENTFIGVFRTKSVPSTQAYTWTNWNNLVGGSGLYGINQGSGDFSYGDYNGSFIGVSVTSRDYLNNWVFHAHSNGASSMVAGNGIFATETSIVSGTNTPVNVGSASTKFAINGQVGSNWSQSSQDFACFAIIPQALSESQLNEIYTELRKRFNA